MPTGNSDQRNRPESTSPDGAAKIRESVPESAAATDNRLQLQMFRYDRDIEEKRKPRFDRFHVPYERGLTVSSVNSIEGIPA